MQKFKLIGLLVSEKSCHPAGKTWFREKRKRKIKRTFLYNKMEFFRLTPNLLFQHHKLCLLLPNKCLPLVLIELYNIVEPLSLLLAPEVQQWLIEFSRSPNIFRGSDILILTPLSASLSEYFWIIKNANCNVWRNLDYFYAVIFHFRCNFPNDRIEAFIIILRESSFTSFQQIIRTQIFVYWLDSILNISWHRCFVHITLQHIIRLCFLPRTPRIGSYRTIMVLWFFVRNFMEKCRPYGFSHFLFAIRIISDGKAVING